ncbi:DUF5004 domain-containing protein [Mucilaginibacter conchicola]|uniref:DUF5004 domain-containing protein n=1 Tax=Mucilaginibacter conchicola TaxID=2303333 RepID=A0A372NXR7_9SPHI|nr:DUF5004 domain-containing protein [Mucilaginibacter conchicola]RFZ94900.1 DUF5004 domain-containing protein [Mucilaginibacter conchicola]
MINKKIFTVLALLVYVLAAASCKTDKLVPDVTESNKDINGTWTISSATQNGRELINLPNGMTHLADFKITFTDGKYTVENPVPFIVSGNGEYKFNDPKYPFDISFTAEGAPAPVKSTYQSPNIQGSRRIVLTFSPGCETNVYKYTLKRTN